MHSLQQENPEIVHPDLANRGEARKFLLENGSPVTAPIVNNRMFSDSMPETISYIDQHLRVNNLAGILVGEAAELYRKKAHNDLRRKAPHIVVLGAHTIEQHEGKAEEIGKYFVDGVRMQRDFRNPDELVVWYTPESGPHGIYWRTAEFANGVYDVLPFTVSVDDCKRLAPGLIMPSKIMIQDIRLATALSHDALNKAKVDEQAEGEFRTRVTATLDNNLADELFFLENFTGYESPVNGESRYIACEQKPNGRIVRVPEGTKRQISPIHIDHFKPLGALNELNYAGEHGKLFE